MGHPPLAHPGVRLAPAGQRPDAGRATSSSSPSTACAGRSCSAAPTATTSRRRRTASRAPPRSASGGRRPSERRAALMPFVWSTIATQGQIFGDPSKGSRVHADQRPVVLVSRLQRDARRAPPIRASTATTRCPIRTSPCSSGSTRRPGFAGTRRGVRLVGRAALHPQHRPQRHLRSAAASRRCRRRRPIASARSTSWPPICRPTGTTAPSTRRSSTPRSSRCAPTSRACSTSCSAKGTSGRTQGRYDLYLDATFRADRFIRPRLGHAAVAAGLRGSDDAAGDDRSRPRRDDDGLDRSREQSAGARFIACPRSGSRTRAGRPAAPPAPRRP